jgi:hypothetical protein
MSLIANTLKIRIGEITASIAAQTAERAAFERVLQIELGKQTSLIQEAPKGNNSHPTPIVKGSEPAVELAGLSFTGNKTTLVADIVKGYGSAGASPKEISDVFTSRNIKRSKNLVYNTLSYLTAQKKLHRHEGRYYALLPSPIAQNHSVPPKKRKLSAAGLKAIREGVKKRWAAKRAAEAAAK